MRLTCTQENFSKGLNIVSRLSDKSINLPILNNVLVQAKKEGIILTVTNLEVGIRTKVRGKIEEEGDFTVQARLLTDFVNTLKKENISVYLDDKNLNIKGENHQTIIRGMDATDFPVVPGVDKAYSFTIISSKIKEALSQVLFAVSHDDSRPELNGVFVKVEDTECTLAATDSYRLAEKKIQISQKSKEKSVIIPAKTIHEVLRILDLQEAQEVTIAINDSQILFSIGETEIISRIINGEYPDYTQIIPQSFKNKVIFDTGEMVSAIKTTSLFCKQGINDVRISLDKRFTDIAVNAENSTFGKNVSNVPSKNKNQEMDIVFNYKFFLDGVLHGSGDTSVLKTNDATSPALLVDKDDESFIYIIMPIKQ